MSENAGSPAKSAVLEVLFTKGMIDEQQREVAYEEAQRTGKKPLDVLREYHQVTEGQILSATADHLHLGYIDLAEYNIDKDLVRFLPEETAKRWTIIPVSRNGMAKLTVASSLRMAMDLDRHDTLRRMLKDFLDIEFVVADPELIKNAIKDLYRADEELRKLSRDATEDDKKAVAGVESIDEDEVISEESPMEQFVTKAILQGIIDGASDIVFETHEHEMLLRYRIDSIWYTKMSVARSVAEEIVSIIKIRSNLNISVRKRAQDGRIEIPRGDGRVDLRVNILPLQYGENVTMRVLDNSQANLRLDDLGFSPLNLDRFRKAINKPYGMVLVTGPTGSGKSVTLYSALAEIATPQKNTHTIEDPIEYSVPNVKQSALNEVQGFTYPEAIRAFMRSAPNIILVGEIRDLDTATVGLQAGMTGHLVLSTLHTNSAAGAPGRLLNMGVEAHTIADTLVAVVAQRLVRRLCDKCKVPYIPTANELLSVGYTVGPGVKWTEDMPIPEGMFIHKENGCKNCRNIGYKGRTAAHEVLMVNREISGLIATQAESGTIQDAARRAGMSLMIEDGWYKVSQGVTTIPEIIKSIIVEES